MSAVNNCNFIGRLGKDPELRFTPNGTAVANIRIAVNERFGKDETTGKAKELTTWVPIVIWRGQAEAVGQHLHKGDRVGINGRFRTRTWDDQNGVTRYITEIHANSVEFLTPRGSSNGNGSSQPPAQQDAPPPLGDDDIPF